MKKILKMLVLGLLSAALLCCALPSAFAAEDKDSQVYTIGLDAMGGSSSAVAVTTNLSGKLSALPAQPTLEGYTLRLVYRAGGRHKNQHLYGVYR